MEKQQPTPVKPGQNQKTIIPNVQNHPTIQMHTAGDGPANQATIKKKQPTPVKPGQNQKTIIPKVQYHPTIQMHTAGDGPTDQASSRPTAKLSPPTGNRKVVQQNQDTHNIIPGLPQPCPTVRKKQNQAKGKLASQAVKTPGPPALPSPHSSLALNESKVLTAGPGVHIDIDEVETQTRGQRNNPKWFAWRKNRITASVAHNIAHSRFVNGKSKTPPTSYLAAITGKSPSFQTRAMTWGVENEDEAVRRYQTWKTDSLRRPVSVQECGLFIDPQRPWLAASPDGIVRDEQTGQRLLCLEVKCPYKHRNRRVEDACREDHAFCLELRGQDGDASEQVPAYSLKKSHSYYTQVQCQLAVTGLQHADFVVYTLKELAVVPVTFDPDLWEKTVSKLQIFYRDAVLPYQKSMAPEDRGAWSPEL